MVLLFLLLGDRLLGVLFLVVVLHLQEVLFLEVLGPHHQDRLDHLDLYRDDTGYLPHRLLGSLESLTESRCILILPGRMYVLVLGDLDNGRILVFGVAVYPD